MNNASGAAAAAILNPSVRAQIRQLFERDGVSPDQISAMLGIPELLVADVLRNSASASASASASVVVPDGSNQSDDSSKLLSDRAANIEDRLSDAEHTALAVLEDVCANAQSDGVRLAAAQQILEIRTGKLRPQKQVTNRTEITIETMNTLIQQATGAYHAQRAMAEATPKIPATVVNVSERN